MRTEQGKLYLLVAIDRTSKFAFVELHERATRRVAGDFLRALIEAVPYEVHTVLTDNGTHFTEPSGERWTACRDQGHARPQAALPGSCLRTRLRPERYRAPADQARHPWTNGQVERMNRTIKEATVKRFHYATHDQLRMHLADFVAAYNFARRLKTLKASRPTSSSANWTREPERFTLDPLHQMPGLNI